MDCLPTHFLFTKLPPSNHVRPIKKHSSTTVMTSKQVKNPTLLTSMFNACDNFITKVIDPPLHPSIDPRNVLSGNFAPVDELPPTDCEVIQGSLPPCLDGAYIRNGPNPQHFPTGPYHVLDGDGMLHSIRISQGKPVFCSRYVKTYKYKVESDIGSTVIPNFISVCLAASTARILLFHARTLFDDQLDLSHGFGTANTSLAFFANHLYALHESDLPYSLRLTSEADIETIGRCDFEGKLHVSMTSHPKIDPETNEVFAFRYDPITHPYLTYFRFDANGNKQDDVPIFSMVHPCILHDFAITKKYAIFGGLQIGINQMAMIMKRGSILSYDPTKVPRIGIIPRYSNEETEMRWFDAPGVNLIHIINAWDEEDTAVVMIATHMLTVEHVLERGEHAHGLIEKLRIDLKTGIVTRKPLSAKNLDFAVINPAYAGKQNQFVYAPIGDPFPKASGLVKLDVSKGCTVATRMYGLNCYSSEPYFIAREPENHDAEEDDGYLVTYIHDEITGESKFLVIDAKSPNLDTVAAVKLPQRVPYGFHGIFVKESDLQKL